MLNLLGRNRLICVAIGFLLLLLSLIYPVIATDWTPLNDNETTIPDDTSEGLNKTMDVIRDIDWNNYIVGTLGFAYTLALLSYSAFYSVAGMLGAAETAANVAGTVGAILLFAAIIIALARGSLKVAKIGSRYFILILVVVIVVSLLFGFLVGV